MPRNFHLGDILSITEGSLVSPRLMDGVYDILDYMTGDSVFTHQLPRAAEECKPWLLRQHPQLTDVEAPKFNGEAEVWAWLAEQVAKFGEALPVEPIPADDHSYRDPVVELAARVGRKEVPDA